MNIPSTHGPKLHRTELPRPRLPPWHSLAFWFRTLWTRSFPRGRVWRAGRRTDGLQATEVDKKQQAGRASRAFVAVAAWQRGFVKALGYVDWEEAGGRGSVLVDVGQGWVGCFWVGTERGEQVDG